MVANNLERKGKTLWTEAGEGEPISFYAGYARTKRYSSPTIDKMLRQNPGDRVAVLYRTNSQSRQIEEALRRYGRKYLVVGGFSYYQRAEVKDAIAYLKLALSPQDSISLLRIINTPARGIGKTTVEQIEQYALTHDISLWTALCHMIDEQQFPGRAQAVPRLDGCEVPLLPEHPHGNVARPRLRPLRRIALRDLRPRPLPVLAELEQVNAREARGEDLVAAVAVPIDHPDAVDHSAVLLADGLPLPLAGPVEHQRRLVAIVGRRGLGAGQRRVDHHRLPAVDLRDPQAVRRGEAVDLR